MMSFANVFCKVTITSNNFARVGNLEVMSINMYSYFLHKKLQLIFCDGNWQGNHSEDEIVVKTTTANNNVIGCVSVS